MPQILGEGANYALMETESLMGGRTRACTRVYEFGSSWARTVGATFVKSYSEGEAAPASGNRVAFWSIEARDLVIQAQRSSSTFYTNSWHVRRRQRTVDVL